MHALLHKALDQAEAEGRIPRNAADALKLPRIDREEIAPLTAEEANRLIEAARGDRLEALYVLDIHTGLRQGELVALNWENLDLEAGTLQVWRTLTHKGGKRFLSEPKTKKSRRTVRLTAGAIAALQDHLKRQIHPPPDACRSFGRNSLPRSPAYVRHALALARRYNPKIVSEMLGHANIAITLDTYSHVLPDMKQKAAKALEGALR
jgi:integrase